MKFLHLISTFLIVPLLYAQSDNTYVSKILLVDKKGNTIYFTDYEYNSSGRISKIIHLDPVTKKPNPSHYSEYIYDNDKLVIINEGSPVLDKPGVYKKNSDVFVYNENGKIESIKTYNALGGKGTTLNVNTYTYDAEGNVASKVTAAKMTGTKDSIAFANYVNGRPTEYSVFTWEKKKKAYGEAFLYKLSYDSNNNLTKIEYVKAGVSSVIFEASYDNQAKNYVNLKISDYNKGNNNPNPNNLDQNLNFSVFTKSYSNLCMVEGVSKTVPFFLVNTYDYKAIKTNEKGFVISYKEEYKYFDCDKKNKQLDGSDTFYQIEYDLK